MKNTMIAFAAIAMIFALPVSAMEGSIVTVGAAKATITTGEHVQLESAATFDAELTVSSNHGPVTPTQTNMAEAGNGVNTAINTAQFEQMDQDIQDGVLVVACESSLATLHTMGDVNMDGVINLADITIIGANYNTSGKTTTQGNVNGDASGDVNFADLLIAAQNYGKRVCTLPPGTACEATLRADLNGNGTVDMPDLEIMKAQYNTTGANLSADITDDGQVNFADLLILSQEYGKIKCSVGPNDNGGPTDNGTTTTPTGNTNTNTNTSSSSSNQTSAGGTGGSGGGSGEVLGTAFGPACGLYLDGFVMKNRTNKLEDIVKVQIFLREKEGATNVAVNGTYDATTQSAVDAFQTKYTNEVLKPWADAGLMSPIAPTTNVYLTTRRMINKLMCPSLNIPMPTLVPFSN